MSQAFPAPYIYPIDRANQNKALQQAGWGGMASYGTVAPAISVPRTAGGRGTINNYVGTFQPPTTTRPPVRHNPNSVYGVNSTAVDGTSTVTQPMAALNSVVPTAVNPVTMAGSPQTSMSYVPDAGGFNLPNYINTVGASGLPAGGTGTGINWFGDMIGKGKEAWNNNKDWLVGDKNSIGAIPLGIGMFNAFNQYTQGRESIKSMREQNALARESFDLNKKGALASLEDQYNKRNTNETYWANPNMSYTSVKDAASAKTLEDMKRFK